VNVIVIGAGMYVCGRGTDGYGTVLPALFQAKKNGLVNSISIVGTNPKNKEYLNIKIHELNQKMGTNVKVEYFPKGDKSEPKAYEQLIDSTNENYCAIVAIPDHLHFEVTKKLIENGIHTLVVKPLSPSISEAKRLIDLQKQNNVYCAVEFHKRFDEANLKIREMINNGKIGDLLYWLVEYSQRNIIPKEHFKAWVKKTNIFQYLGVHYVDIIYFCTNSLPIRVMATGQKNLLIKEGIDAYDAIQALIEWKDKYSGRKFVSTILTNWIDPISTSAMSDQKIKVIGTLGRIESDQKNRGVQVISDTNGIEDINPYFSDFYYDISDETMNFKGYGCDSIVQFIADTQSIINRDKAPRALKGLRATFEEALISTAVIEAVNISLRNGNKWVNMNRDFNITPEGGDEAI
jgi:predicted dehydrogenase